MTLAAFGVRSFRFQWPADLITSWAFEMETLILGWFVIVDTGSVLLLTVFASLQSLGTLAAPMFGVLGDALGARVLLCAMRAIYAVFAVLLMTLSFSGSLTPAWVFIVAGIVGVVRPNDQVMRNSLIGETIPPHLVMGAVGMSRASMDSARVAGALTGAGLMAVVGMGYAYGLVTTLYVVSLALTFGVSRARTVRGTLFASNWSDLKAGLTHVLATPKLLALMWLAFVVNVTAYPVTSGLLPYVARSVYMTDATGLGWLVASFQLGALLGSITMVATGTPRHPARTTLTHTFLWLTLLLVFAYAPSMSVGLLVLFPAGFVQSVAMVTMTTTLLATTGQGFHSRVMGVRMLAVYGMTMGLILTGALTARIGFTLTVTALGALGLVFTLLIGLRWRASMWHTERVSSLDVGPQARRPSGA